MHSNTTMLIVVVAAIFTSTTTISSASVISCPPNSLQEATPNLRQLCYALEQVIGENVLSQETYGRLDDRNVNVNAKRQDVDHVFLRFGRRFGL